MSQTLVRPAWMDDPDVVVTSGPRTAAPAPAPAPTPAPVPAPAAVAAQAPAPAWMSDPDVVVTKPPPGVSPTALPVSSDPDVTITAAPPAPALSQTLVPGQPDPNVPTVTVQPEPQGVFGSAWSGIGDAFREGSRLGSGGAFDSSQATPEVERTWGGRLTYGVAHSAPTLAMTFLGGAAGGALGSEVPVVGNVVGGITGAAIAGAAATAAQTIIPAYDAAVRQGLDHDAAVNQALKMAAAQGALGGISGTIMGAPLFRSMVGKFLFNTAAVNPTVGLVNRGIVTPQITGQEPTSDQLASGVVEDWLAGAAMHGAIKGGQAVAPRLSGLFGRGTPAPAPDPNTPPAGLLPTPPAGLLPAPGAAGTTTSGGATATTKPGTSSGSGTGTGAGGGAGGRTDTVTVDIRPATHDPVTGNPRPVEDQLKNLNQGITVAQSVIDNPGQHPPDAVATAQAWIKSARAKLDQLAAATPAQSAATGAGTTAAGGSSATSSTPGVDTPAAGGPPPDGTASTQGSGGTAPNAGPAPVDQSGTAPPAPTPTDQAPPVSSGTVGTVSPPVPSPGPEPPTNVTLTPNAGQLTQQQVTTTATGRKLNTQFEVHDAADLIPASGDLQPRDRQDRVQADLQRQDIRANLDPERLHASPEADRGSPIIDDTKTILAGNNRVRAINDVHLSTDPGDQARSKAYRDMVQRVTGQDVSGMKSPILTRRITDTLTHPDKVEISRDANVAATQDMSDTEQAKVDAAQLTHDHIATLKPDQDLNSAGNRPFVASWMKTLPPTALNKVQSATGGLSPAGARRLNAAVLARAYDDNGLLARGLDSMDDEVRAITSGLSDAAPTIAQMRSKIGQGKLHQKYDLSRDIAQAVDLVRDARSKGKSRDDILRQTDMFSGTTLSPTVEALVRSFYNPAGTRAASRTSIANTLRDYSRLSQEQGADLLGTGGARDPAAILKDINDARARNDQSQGTLAPITPAPAATPTPTPTPAPAPAPVATGPKPGEDGYTETVNGQKFTSTLAKNGQMQHRINGKLTTAGDWHRARFRAQDGLPPLPKPKTPAKPKPVPKPAFVAPPTIKSRFLPRGGVDELWLVPAHTPGTAHQTALDWVLAQGKDGVEHSAIIVQDTGLIQHASTNYQVDGVTLMAPVGIGTDAVAYYHNHPRDTSLSPQDVALLSYRGFSYMVAAGKAHISVATLGSQARQITDQATLYHNINLVMKQGQIYADAKLDDLIHAGKLPPEKKDFWFTDLIHRTASALYPEVYEFYSTRDLDTAPALKQAFENSLRKGGLSEDRIRRSTHVSGRSDLLDRVHQGTRARYQPVNAGSGGLGKGIPDLKDTDSPGPGGSDDTETGPDASLISTGPEPPEGVDPGDWENFTQPNDFDAGNGVLSDDDIPPELKPETGDEPSIQEEEEEPPISAATDKAYNDLLGTIAKLTGAPQSKANRVKLQDTRIQLKRREAAIARTRAAWKPKHQTSTPGAPKSFLDYKFADGTSVFHGAFTDAGLKPELWVNKPIAEQNAVLAKQVKAKFGFNDVVIHASADAKQANDQLLDTYKSGQDMANALSLPYTALGMNGRITLRLQGQGRRDYYGVYEPGTMTVGVVGQAQSFMHEWIHALDHMLSDQLVNAPNRRELLSKNARDNDLVPGQHDVLASFAKLINTVFYDDQDLIIQRLRLENTAQQTNRYTNQPTTKALDAQRQLDKLEGGASRLKIKPSAFRAAAQGKPNAQYWASAHELLARLGEAWAARMAQNAGISPRGLVMQDEAYLLHTDPRIASTFPSGSERMRMFDALNKLFEDIRHAAIFPGQRGAKSTDKGMSDPSTWGKLNPKHDDTSSDIVTAFKRDYENVRNLKARYKLPFFYDPTRPDRGTPVRRADLFRQHAYSSMAMMQTIITHAKKHAPAGAPYLQELLDKLMHDPGSGRLVHEVWEEMVRRRSRRTTLAFTNALKDWDLDEMTPLQGQMLRHVLTTGDDTYPTDPSIARGGPRVPIPTNIQKVAEPIRLLLKQEYDWLKESGIPLSYAQSGYFPRMFDDSAISADGDRFKGAATELYKLMFDRDVGEVDPDPVKMLSYWKEVPDFDKSQAPAQLTTDMKAMARKLRRMDQIDAEIANVPPRTNIDPKLIAERDKLETEVAALADQNSGPLGTLVGERGAHDWHIRVLAGGPTDFDTRGPSAKFTRGRELPPEADQIMREFLISDPKAAIGTLLEASARRGAFARQFGVENNLIDRNLDLAAAAGVPGEDLTMFRNLIEQNTGRSRNTYSRLMVRGANYISAWATMMLLPKAVFSTIHEPMAAALSTRDMKFALGTFGRQFRNIIDKSSRRETAELADFLGVTTSVLHESVMVSRGTTDYRDTPNVARVMSGFFRLTMLTQMTTAQRRAGMASGSYALRRWANQAASPAKTNKRGFEPRKIANRRDDAQRLLRELGVPDAHHKDLATWLNSFDGVPTVAQVQADPMGELFGAALSRLVNRTNQDPMRVQKPMRSNDPVGKLMFALTPFLYSFWQNVMEPATHRPGHAYDREYQRTLDRRTAPRLAAGGGAGGAGTGGPGGTGAGAAGPPRPPGRGDRFVARARAGAAFSNEVLHVFMMFLPLFVAGLLSRMLYDLLWNRDAWDKHEKKGDLEEWLIGQTMSSIGVAGPLDIVVQAFTHMRYEADLAKLAEGAYTSTLLTNARNMLAPWMNPNAEANTNAAVYDQTLAAVKLFWEPAAMLVLTKVSNMFPGGAITSAAAIVAWEASSATNIRGLTDWLVGSERGTKDPTLDHGGNPIPEGPNLDDILPDLPDPLGGGTGHGEKEDHAGSGGLESVAVSLLDDIMVPLLKAVPGPLKAAGFTALGGYAAWDWFNRTSVFRGAPPPEPKP